MERTKKLLRNLSIFLVLIILTFYIILKDQDITQVLGIFTSTKKQFIVIAILCMFFFIICEAINIRRTLRALGEKTSLLKTIKYAFIGFFFSSITPAASGGQPMQIYHMHKDNISVANATLALLINLSCVQVATISIALVSFFFNFEHLNSALIWLFVIGVGLNLTALFLLIVSICSKRMTKGIINFSIKVLKFFRVKNIEQKRERFERELALYQDSAGYIKNNIKLAVKALLTTYIQYIVYYSISYWVYCSFGLSEYNIIKIITMQSVLYATVSGIPSPGAVGVSEGGFIAIFSKVFPEAIINSAMLLNRGINFYLFVILSAIVSIVNTIREKKVERTEEIVEEINTNNYETKKVEKN
jgi:hypothetical protein